jgi:hypothetical protein
MLSRKEARNAAGGVRIMREAPSFTLSIRRAAISSHVVDCEHPTSFDHSRTRQPAFVGLAAGCCALWTTLLRNRRAADFIGLSRLGLMVPRQSVRRFSAG